MFRHGLKFCALACIASILLPNNAGAFTLQCLKTYSSPLPGASQPRSLTCKMTATTLDIADTLWASYWTTLNSLSGAVYDDIQDDWTWLEVPYERWHYTSVLVPFDTYGVSSILVAVNLIGTPLDLSAQEQWRLPD